MNLKNLLLREIGGVNKGASLAIEVIDTLHNFDMLLLQTPQGGITLRFRNPKLMFRTKKFESRHYGLVGVKDILAELDEYLQSEVFMESEQVFQIKLRESVGCDYWE